MPTYEFRCAAGHTFDRFLKMSEAPLELACVECDKPAIRQMSGGAGLVFKGSGFYLTDYGRAGQKPPAAEGSTAARGDSKGGDSRGGDSRGGDSRGGDSKGGDSKGGDSKGGDSKPAKAESAASAATAPAKSDKSSSTKSPKSSE